MDFLKLAFLALTFNLVSAWRSHESSSDLFIHSNDTFKVTLAENQQLYGPPGSRHSFRFVIHSNIPGLKRFTIRLESEDGMRGQLSRNYVSIEGGNSAEIVVNDLTVPQTLKSGMHTQFSLIVRKEDYKRKREAENPPQNPVGGSNYNQGGGSIGGSSGYGGSDYNQGGSGYPGYNNNNGGSIGGSDYNQGGSGYPGYNNNNGGSIGGSDYNNGGYGGGGNNYNNGGNLDWNNNNDPGYNDPSNKREVMSTVEFRVTNGQFEEDKDEPWYKMEYGAESEDETCQFGPGEPNCNTEWWWVKFRIQDEESGLHLVDVSPGGKDTYREQVYYRYNNFPIGTTKEHEVIAAASCCLEGIRMRVQDVSGVVAEAHATWDGTGSGGLSMTTIYWIIGACAAVVLIIIIVVTVVLCKKYKYDAVSQNP